MRFSYTQSLTLKPPEFAQWRRRNTLRKALLVFRFYFAYTFAGCTPEEESDGPDEAAERSARLPGQLSQ